MERMNRAGRKIAVEVAIRKLVKRGKHDVFTKGEIARAMGLRSSTYLRDLLDEMCLEYRLVCVKYEVSSSRDLVMCYGVVNWQQRPLPERYITINGKSMRAL